jgi:hypothetical protein
LVTLLTTRGTGALTSPLVASSSPDMLCLTSWISPTTPPLHLFHTLSWRLFPDQVVQPPLSVFPFPVGYPGAPPPLPVPSVMPRAALAPSPALSAAPTPSAAPHAAPTPSHATSATPVPSPTPRMAPAPSLVPSTAPALPPAPRAASQVPANYAPLMRYVYEHRSTAPPPPPPPPPPPRRSRVEPAVYHPPIIHRILDILIPW